MTRPQIHDTVTRVRLPLPLHTALKMTAAQRNTTISDVIRMAVAKDLAGVPQAPAKAQPAQQ